MKPEIVSRPLLLVLLEVFYFVGAVHFASTPAASHVPIGLVGAALVVGCIAIPLVVATPAFGRSGTFMTGFVAFTLIASGSLPALGGHELLGRDVGVAAMGAILLLLPIRLDPPDATGPGRERPPGAGPLRQAADRWLARRRRRRVPR